MVRYFNVRSLFGKALLLVLSICITSPTWALQPLTQETMNDAIHYGLTNQQTRLSSFLGNNWQEGADGALLNIYTPYMLIARDVVGKKLPTDPTPDDIAVARKKIKHDIDYYYAHPEVKFMASLYGNTPEFAANYFARIEGVGNGRRFTLYPSDAQPQYKATRDNAVKGADAYTAINAYHFNYDEIAQLEQYTLMLYGKNLKPYNFKIQNKSIQ